jgi:hypothetical protein
VLLSEGQHHALEKFVFVEGWFPETPRFSIVQVVLPRFRRHSTDFDCVDYFVLHKIMNQQALSPIMALSTTFQIQVQEQHTFREWPYCKVVSGPWHYLG